MQAAIASRCTEPDKQRVKELVLDGCRIQALTAEDAEVLKEFKSLEMLGLNAVGLTSLANLPAIPTLSSLELQDNLLDDTAEYGVLGEMSRLQSVLLGGNRITTLDALRPLQSLERLEELDLILNPLCDNIRKEACPNWPPGKDEDEAGQFYRAAAFTMFPHLQRVDRFD
eukprot:Polyplicarium_translucidae@DN3384_c2_g1_i12.p3